VAGAAVADPDAAPAPAAPPPAAAAAPEATAGLAEPGATAPAAVELKRSPVAPAAVSRRAAVSPERPRVALQDGVPEAPLSETPAIGGTSAQRLARALGTDVGVDEQGNVSVDFPQPGGAFAPFSTAPMTVSRVETEAPPQPAVEPQATAPAPDIDEIAENVIEKLRRELLIEREQAGGPMELM
jgi:hypothetical protein